jgi:hypothetical protein
MFKFCNDSEADCTEFQIPQFNFRSFDFDFPRPTFVTKNRRLGVEMEEIDGQLTSGPSTPNSSRDGFEKPTFIPK